MVVSLLSSAIWLVLFFTLGISAFGMLFGFPPLPSDYVPPLP